MPKRKSKKRKLSRRRRAYEQGVRLIAKEDGITVEKARKRYKQAVIEVIFIRPGRTVDRRFLEISPGKFLEIMPGKLAKVEYTFGKVRTVGYVSRVLQLLRYWAGVRIMAGEFDISIQEARKRLRRDVDAGKTMEEIFYELFKEEITMWPRVKKSLRKRMLGRQA